MVINYDKPYSVLMPPDGEQYRAMVKWCIENIDADQSNKPAQWDWYWTGDFHRAFCFTNEKDAMLFALRWM